jgi:cellulose synthase/poly-beta-1,6-N-acetylglucosamine synthase-like glycosyltransferase
MELIKIILGSCFVFVTALLILNGLHRYITIYRYFKVRHKKFPAPPKLDRCPKITVQLPIFNERYVAARVLNAASQFDYPKEALEIQVLDDSTDETQDVLQQRVRELQAAGLNVRYLHRTDRTGFKAGALENGQKSAAGEFIAIFDADFIPPKDFLQKTIPHFYDPRIGMIQTRWGHINRGYSLMTKMLAILLDSHFVVEHIARSRDNLFFNFNGTAGIWRRACIVDAGGWEHDTLTEDMDLSFRAQLKGWQFIYLPEIVCPAELPPEINAVKSQQFRWAKGSLQTARKLLPAIWRAKIPFRQKLEATFHLTSYLPTLWAVYASLFVLPSLLLWGYKATLPIIMMNVVLFILTSVTFFLFFEISQRETETNIIQRVMNSFLLMSVWMGLSISNSKAIIEGIFNIKSDFKRTPKFRIEQKGDSWTGKKYVETINPVILIEAALVIYLAYTFWYVMKCKDYFIAPFVAAFIYGFGYTAFLSFRTIFRQLRLKD